jgi:hypothetical protein
MYRVQGRVRVCRLRVVEWLETMNIKLVRP